MVGASLVSLLGCMGYYLYAPEIVGHLLPVATDWIWILFLALVCTVYANTMSTQLMKQFTAYLINLTINLEPVYGIALAYLIFGEKEIMTHGFYMGTLLILMAVLLYPVLSRGLKLKSKAQVSG